MKSHNKFHPYYGLSKSHSQVACIGELTLHIRKNLIKSSHPKTDGLVVIPFSGSGSECFVAKQLGLNVIGFDNNKDWVTMGNQLINTNWEFNI